MARRRLLVAHVLHGEAAAAIDGLRRAFGGPVGRIAPHLTLVPPRNLATERTGELIEHLDAVARAHETIALRLEGPGTFAPVTPVLYIAVAGELAALRNLVGQLGSGPLAAPEGRQPRPFVPHVTLSHHLDDPRLAGALASLGVLGIEVSCERLVVMEQDETPDRAWHEVEDVALGGRAVVGRGGRELTFETHEILGPSLAALIDAARPPGVSAGRPLLIAARSGGAPVALAAGSTEGALAYLDGLLVVAGARGEGIGTATLARFEDEAHRRGARLVQAASDPFLVGRGYREVRSAPLVERELRVASPTDR